MSSFFLSTIRKNPFESRVAMSPVFNHPSEVIDSLVAASLLRYPYGLMLEEETSILTHTPSSS